MPASSASLVACAHATPSHRPFAGLWIPLVTPFRDGAVDLAALAAMTQRLAAQGVTGFVACGSTGEAAALDPAEQIQVLETVLQAAQGRPVVMGLSGYHLGQVLDWVQQLNAYPLAGLLVPAPHYIRPSQAGLAQWFERIANASSPPLVIYDIPYRTGAVLQTSTLLQLADHPRIQAIKDCGGDAGKTQALIHDGRLTVLSGEDAQIFSTLTQGGGGVIAASAHWQAPQFLALMDLLRQGQLPEARALWQQLQPWIASCFAESNPAPLKALLAHAGWMRNELRAPMMAASPALDAQMLALAQTQAQQA